MNERDDEDDHDPIEVLLQERGGLTAAPDLTAAVLGRLQRGDAARAAGQLRWQRATPRTATPRWLVAAMLLLGTAVVLGTRWLQTPPTTEPGPAQAAQQDPPSTLLPQDPQSPPAIAGLPLRVLDSRGGPVQSFELEFGRQNGTATSPRSKVAEFPPRRFAPVDFPGDFTTVAGLPDGTYVAVVTADAHARTLSAPFTVQDGKAPPLTVTLNHGGEVRGVVRGPEGRPLAGAVVESRSPSVKAGQGTPMGDLLRSMLPDWSTRATATTDAKGEFRLPRLSYGTYSLSVDHPTCCRAEVENVEVGPTARTLEPVTLLAGAQIAGRVLVDGVEHAGAKLWLVSLAANGEPSPDATRWPTTSGEGGRFEFPRVPPGQYRLSGSRSTDPLGLLHELKNSECRVTVQAGSDRVTQDVTISARR